jgi:hypothetical protein
MKTINKFKIFEAGNYPENEVQEIIQMFKSDPKKYHFDLKKIEKFTEDDWIKIAQNYLDFPFRMYDIGK